MTGLSPVRKTKQNTKTYVSEVRCRLSRTVSKGLESCEHSLSTLLVFCSAGAVPLFCSLLQLWTQGEKKWCEFSLTTLVYENVRKVLSPWSHVYACSNRSPQLRKRAALAGRIWVKYLLESAVLLLHQEAVRESLAPEMGWCCYWNGVWTDINSRCPTHEGRLIFKVFIATKLNKSCFALLSLYVNEKCLFSTFNMPGHRKTTMTLSILKLNVYSSPVFCPVSCISLCVLVTVSWEIHRYLIHAPVLWMLPDVSAKVSVIPVTVSFLYWMYSER